MQSWKCGIAAALFAVAHAASAAPITFNFTGVVSDGVLDGERWGTGATVTGTYVLDIANAAAVAADGTYSSVAGCAVVHSPSGQCTSFGGNDQPIVTAWSVKVGSFSVAKSGNWTGLLATTVVPGVRHSSVQVQELAVDDGEFGWIGFRTQSLSVFASLFAGGGSDPFALPDLSSSVASFDLVDKYWECFWWEQEQCASTTYRAFGVELRGYLTSWTRADGPVEVPEPASAALLGLALAGLVVVRRKRFV